MYTIGQVANFLGVSRDTLKYYEEKELVKPKYDDGGSTGTVLVLPFSY